MYRFLGVAVLFALATVAGVNWLPGGAPAAYASCNPGRSNDYYNPNYVGSKRTTSGIGGVYSDIDNYAPWVYPISTTESSSSQWVMLHNTQNYSYYAQVGVLALPYGYRFTFYEYYDGGGMNQHKNIATPAAAHSYYTMLYGNGGSGIFTFQIDGVTVKTVGNLSWAPNEAQVMAETWSNADQIAGGYASYAHANFNDTHVWLGSWGAFSGIGINSDPAIYTLNGTSTYNFSTWDNACSS